MPFGYYARLTRAQQAVYRKSDAVTEIRLDRPETLRPAVDTLAAALAAEDRPATQRASERLVGGLAHAMGMPAVRVEVLAARPHAGWGELHGLYTAERGRAPTIQLWMRTAKRKRVVAFRTYLRTLLHEVGHHVDYTLLRLPESYHTEGFYKRESSLFHQLVPEGRTTMPTFEEYARQPLADRLARAERTPDELAAAIRGRDDATLSRRPDPRNWAPKEIVCHLRDVEEVVGLRFEQIMAMEEPRFAAVNPDRWAEERQYLRHDAAEAVNAFRRRRLESLAFVRGLPPAHLQRAGIHAARGRMTIDDFVTLMAWHDDNHLDQLGRALQGKS
jgi:hypothetical protein